MGGRAMLTLVSPDGAGVPAPRRGARVNFFELAYQRLEDMLVGCALKPGQFLAMQDLQQLTGLGRTPVHQAVNRLAADTLLVVRPRQGIQIAPIDLARERLLLGLRRSLEGFVVQLAAERSGPSHRNQMLHLQRLLRDRRDELSLEAFNALDRRIDTLVLAVANEPFLEHALRPLHTIFRRIGWLHHTHIRGHSSIAGTVDHHLAILNAVANRRADQAVAASGALIDFVDGMFDRLEQEIDPCLLDCSIEPFAQA
jgi:DNA-binding GntR family transcriptional regulator